MKIAITGHRPNKLGNDYDLVSPLLLAIKDKLQNIIDFADARNAYNENEETTTLISGMALGIDTLWAKLAIENGLSLIAAIPCFNQDKMWLGKSKKLYADILANPLTTIEIISHKEYSPDCMQKRNIWMVDNCDLLIAVWDGSDGGTANCVNYAQSPLVNRNIIIINPQEIKNQLTFNSLYYKT